MEESKKSIPKQVKRFMPAVTASNVILAKNSIDSIYDAMTV